MEKLGEIGRATDRPEDFDIRERLRWRVAFAAGLLLVAAVGVLFAAGLVGFQLTHADTVFPGVRVGQVQIGGMTRERVATTLQPILVEMGNRPLAVRALGVSREATLVELGAVFDSTAAVDAAFAVGRTGNWVDRLGAQFGALTRGLAIETPGLRLDRSKLLAYVAQQAREVDRPVKDAEVVIGDDLSVRVIASAVGRKMDSAAAATAVEQAMATEATLVDLPVAETQPGRTEKELEPVAASLSKMLSGAVAMEFEGHRWSWSAGEIRALLTVDQKVGIPAPVVSMQEKPLTQFIDRIASEIDQPKVNARFDWNGGNLKQLKAGQDGRKVNKEKAVAALKGAISGDQRTVALPVEVDQAAGTAVDPAQMGIKERIEYGQTTVAGVPEKQYNIKLASSRLNGVLLAPGDLFSFNRELGPTTLKSGFQTGFGISVSNGQMETVPSVAGGICQVATTLVHAVFWAGYQIEERYPHMYWIPNYGRQPRGITGLDATVDDPTLDLKFLNNTENYLLIQSSVNGSTLEFALYGTKPTWKVEVEGPIISNVVKADTKTVRQEEPTWAEGRELWVESATDGMDVDIIRKVTQGTEVRTLHLKSHYLPSRNVLMVGTKKAEPTPGPTPSGTPAPGAAPQGTPAPGATPGQAAPAGTPAPTTPAAAGPTPTAGARQPTAAPVRPASTQKPAATPSPQPTQGR